VTESRGAGAIAKRAHPSSAIGVRGARATGIWSVKRNRTVEGRAGHGTRSYSVWRGDGSAAVYPSVSRETGRELHNGARHGAAVVLSEAGAAAALRRNACTRRGAEDDDSDSGRLGRCWDGAGPATWQGWPGEEAPFVHATDRTICALETAAAGSAQTIARGESARQPVREVERRFSEAGNATRPPL
jgi:hypothetical protein